MVNWIAGIVFSFADRIQPGELDENFTTTVSLSGADPNNHSSIGFCFKKNGNWIQHIIHTETSAITLSLFAFAIYLAQQVRKKLKEPTFSTRTKRLQRRSNNMLFAQTFNLIVLLPVPLLLQPFLLYSGTNHSRKEAAFNHTSGTYHFCSLSLKMDTYEKLEVQPGEVPPPPPPDLPPPPPPPGKSSPAPLMPPMKEQKEKDINELKPLRAGDDVNLSDTPKKPLLPKASPAKPIKANQKSNQKGKRPVAGKSTTKSKSSQSGMSSKSNVQIVLLMSIGVSLAFALIFMFMTIFGLLHLKSRAIYASNAETLKKSGGEHYCDQFCSKSSSTNFKMNEEKKEIEGREGGMAVSQSMSNLGDENEIRERKTSTRSLKNSWSYSVPSFVSMSGKLGELWTSARESIFGEDYWIPSNVDEVTQFPPELLQEHKIVFPENEFDPPLRVVQGSYKNNPSEKLFHVVASLGETPNSPVYSLFRSNELEDAVDLCRRCMECQMLFKFLDSNNDTKRRVQDVMIKLKQFPLYGMIHIAIACDRMDLFTNDSIENLDNTDNSFKSHMNMMVQPEGKYPLLLAIEMHRLEIVRRMLALGADPMVVDINGNNVMHYASVSGVPVIELLWEFEECHGLINHTNDEGYTPVMLAIRAASPRCVAALLNCGAELTVVPHGRNPLFEAVQSKGTTPDIIKALLHVSPELLTERDSTGNTVVHAAKYKSSLVGLMMLKSDDIDLDATNNIGQTPLHIYTHKGAIGLMVTILSNGCNINAQDRNGNTALHVAATRRNTEAARLLLCLGANPNISNANGDSPRHMAARLKEASLLESLVMCGALPCKPNKLGCVSGCTSDLTSVQRNSEAVNMEEPIREFIQKQCYDGLIARLEELANRGEKPHNMINLLSMDGGGIRGLAMIQVLMEIEKELNESVFSYFDWVAGTSTGALLATGLAQGKSLRECQHLYLRFKDFIFNKWTLPYDAAAVEEFMKETVGEETMKEIDYPRLMFSTVKADRFPVKLEYMRNYRLPISEEDNVRLGFGDPADIPTWKALRRTSAAPMFFPPDDVYIDGGIIANNPLLDLLSEVELYNGTNTYLGQPEKNVEIGCVLSFGTGQIPSTRLDPLHIGISNPISSALNFKNLSLVIVDQVAASEGAPVDRSFSWCNALRIPFFRFSAPLRKAIGVTTKNDNDIATMMWDCVEYSHKNRTKIVKLCELLKRIGKTPNDRERISIAAS
ncbi:unnamed protein product [Cylicocyclus nassatus]|uniref:phospholipase A2 n=1 Tax=Cylicocyclus nassatus TaxID=53992 RepID=A0AA36HCZ9_CYLNA|nr:unnamed protein product [Cylicocyclus nassatus]